MKIKKTLPPIDPSAKSSYVTRACSTLHYQTVHLLLRAGADPNGGEGVDIPPLVNLLITLKYVNTFFGKDMDKKRAETLKLLGVIIHLVECGADPNRRSKVGTKLSPVEILEKILDGGPGPSDGVGLLNTAPGNFAGVFGALTRREWEANSSLTSDDDGDSLLAAAAAEAAAEGQVGVIPSVRGLAAPRAAEFFPLAEVVAGFLAVKEDPVGSGKKIIKCLNRGIDGFVKSE